MAYVSNSMIPGFTLALGFLLGAIISPPNAVAASSGLKNVSVPRRIIVILKGESLINNASSLIVFRFALAAVISSQFSFEEAVSQFFIVSVMGIVIGVAIGKAMYYGHRYLPTTPSIDAALTLMTPYFMYMAAEHFHFSGVMAVVSGGVFLSYNSHEILSQSSGIQATSLWSTVVFVLNGLVFILIAFELPVIINDLGDYSIFQAITYGLVISLLTIIIPLLYTFPIAYVPLWFGNIARKDPANPPFMYI